MCAISPFSPCSWFPLYLRLMPKSCTENTRTHMREERRKWREVMHTKAREATTTTDGWTGNRHPPTSLDGLSEQARGNRLRRVLLQLQFLFSSPCYLTTVVSLAAFPGRMTAIEGDFFSRREIGGPGFLIRSLPEASFFLLGR